MRIIFFIAFLFFSFVMYSQSISIGFHGGYQLTQLHNKDDYGDKKSLIMNKSCTPGFGLVAGIDYKKWGLTITPLSTIILQNYTIAQDTGQKLHATAFEKLNIIQVPISISYKIQSNKTISTFLSLGLVYNKLQHTSGEYKGTIYDSIPIYGNEKDSLYHSKSANFPEAEGRSSEFMYKKIYFGYCASLGLNYKLMANLLFKIQLNYTSTFGTVENRKPMWYSSTLPPFPTQVQKIEDAWSTIKPRFIAKSSTDKSIRPATYARQLGLSISLLYSFNINKKNNE